MPNVVALFEDNEDVNSARPLLFDSDFYIVKYGVNLDKPSFNNAVFVDQVFNSMIEDLTGVYNKRKMNTNSDQLISLFSLKGDIIDSFVSLRSQEPRACIVSFKGSVNGLKDNSTPMTEQEEK